MRIRTFFHITKGRGGQGQHKFKSNYSRDQRFLTETRLCYKYLQQKKTQIMIQTVGLRHFSETTMSVHFLILGGWLDQLHVCKPHYWILFLLFASLVNFSNAQVIRGGPEFSVKKILFYCVIQDALFSIWLFSFIAKTVTIQWLPAYICSRRSLSTKGI